MNFTSPFIISHRGAAGCAPENTMASVKKAVDLGASFVEIDIRRTRDGELVVIHDATVDRTTNGTGSVDRLSWAYIETLDAGSWFDNTYREERIPRLEDILAYMKTKNAIPIIEVKDPQNYPGIGDQLYHVLSRYEMEQRAIVISFDGEWLGDFTKNHPAVTSGSLYKKIEEGEKTLPKVMDVHWVSILLRPLFPSRLHKKGGIVVAWTVDSGFWMRVLLCFGVDGITTNRPDIGMRVLSRYEGGNT